MPSTSRIRLGLYTVVLAALVVAAVVALISLGTHGHGSPAAAAPSGPHTSSVPSTPVSTPTSASGAPSTRAASTPPAATQSPSSSKTASPTHPTRMDGANHSARAATRAAKVYTVKPGDNLTVIAAWFHVRGYQPLYSWNQSVIGRNPNLIFPGQKIIVVPGGSVSVQARH